MGDMKVGRTKFFFSNEGVESKRPNTSALGSKEGRITLLALNLIVLAIGTGLFIYGNVTNNLGMLAIGLALGTFSFATSGVSILHACINRDIRETTKWKNNDIYEASE